MTNSDQTPRRIAVLGGGISGLAAAYTLARARQRGARVEELVIEANDRLGGVVRTEEVEGFVLEAGPDSFLTEKPEAAALCQELGLGDALLGSNDTLRRTYILHRSRLVPLPEGLQLFIPTRLWPVFATPLLTWRSKLAIVLEWFRSQPPANQPADESVASFIRRHFGNGLLQNIADPLLAGVFGGDSSTLSACSVLPRFWEMERRYGSLIRGVLEVRKQRCPGREGFAPKGRKTVAAGGALPCPPPLFTTLRYGLGQMVKELGKHLAVSRVFLGQRVIGIEASTRDSVAATGPLAGQYRIMCRAGTADRAAHEADAIILALPAHECARLLSTFEPLLAESFKVIPYASALTVALGYDAGAFGHVPPGFGFLVPQKEHRSLLACTFVQNKFSYRVPPGKVLLRCFLGGSRNPEVMNFEDHEIVALVRRELRAILNLSAEPLFYRINRWPSSMPQYPVGHQDLVSAIQTRLETHPGLFVAGNAYSGIGISDCIRTGISAGERALRDSTS